jgi:glyoxylase-like metal-dependent hydrolase (beta-lactamase superfamily II)
MPHKWTHKNNNKENIMGMKTTIISGFISAVAFALPHTASAQIVFPEWDEVEIKVEELGNDLYMLQGFGSNIGAYVGPDGIFLVDNEYAPLSAKIQTALKELSPNKVRYVVNTHWHRDHRGGNENFAHQGAQIIAHKDTRRIMNWAQNEPDMSGEITHSAETLPTLVYDKQMTLHLGAETVTIKYIPNVHTSGDSLVLFKKANVIQTGDMYFNGFYPFIDVQFGGSIDNMITFYDELYALADKDTKIIPGHGPISNRAQVRIYQNMLRTVRERVANAIEQGTSLEELTAAKPLADLDAEWGDNLITADWMLGMVYRDLVKHGVRHTHAKQH